MKHSLLLLSLLAFASQADTLTVRWTPPTTRVDGTALPSTEIAGYRLEWTVKGVPQSDKVVTGAVSTYTLDTGTLSGRTCVTLYTQDTDGLESAPAQTACRNAKPNPPTGVTVK